MAVVLLRQVRRLDPAAGLDSVDDWLWDAATGQMSRADGPPAVPERTIDGEGRLIVGPSLCDLYAHSGEPGHEEREDLRSLAAAALAGGYSQVALLPDTDPPVDEAAQVDSLRRKLPLFGIEALVLGAMTRSLKGESLADLADLSEAGVAGFTDARPITNWALLRRFLDYAAVFEKPVLVWPCLAALATGVALEGTWAVRLGLSARPVQAETIALTGLLELVRLTGRPIHLMRLSTARAVELVRQAKAEGLPITASTTIYHLSHASPELTGFDPRLRFDPPLGNPEDRAALIAALADGTIDAVVSDHTPWTYEEKTLPFALAPAGAIALELTLPLLWTLVRGGSLDPLRAWAALSSAPRSILALENAPQSYVLFDPDQSWTPDSQTLKSRSQSTIWYGRPLQGRVLELLRRVTYTRLT